MRKCRVSSLSSAVRPCVLLLPATAPLHAQEDERRGWLDVGAGGGRLQAEILCRNAAPAAGAEPVRGGRGLAAPPAAPEHPCRVALRRGCSR